MQVWETIKAAVKRHTLAIAGVLLAVLVFGLGFYAGRSTAVPAVVEVPVEKPVVQTKTETVIKYVEKPSAAAPDVDVKVPLQEIKVAVNGKEQVIKKAESEKYVFDDHQLKLEQHTAASVDIKVPDKTRHWSIGVGAGSHGVAYSLRFPVYKNVGGWAYGDRKTVAGGLSFNF